MADALKTFFSAALVRRLAADVKRVSRAFDDAAFVRDATRGLDRLELLDRGRHIMQALRRHLPDDFERAIDVLLRAAGPEHPTDEMVGAGMAPFYYLPHVLYVAEYGLDHFDASMRAQHALTKRFTAESSIRPFIARDPERTFAYLERWAGDESAHVRRLVSEGTRLRLPWAPRVAWLEAHPERVLALLERLKDDPSPYVRRSVANNLNDLGKVYPALLVEVAGRWLEGASPARRALIEHALRGAVKRGEAAALRLLGYGRKPAVIVEDVVFSPRRVAIGGRVTIEFTVRSAARVEQDLLIDLAVHFVKARGTSAKVFKVKRVTLPPGGRAGLRAGVSLAVHTTRVPRPGTHAVDVIVNGVRHRIGSFEVVRSTPRARSAGASRSRCTPRR